jgi:hypothetical protein
MISKILVFTYICTLYAQNKFAWHIMIVDDYFVYQRNTESDYFLELAGQYSYSNDQFAILTNSA